MNSNTILLVDDDPFVVKFYAKRLEQAGFKTVSAPDGQAVIDWLPSLSADLIVLDLLLPKIHGLQVLEAIRADNRHKHTPVVILSNAYLPHIARKAIKAGANEGLLKAECTPIKLISIIGRLLAGASTPGGRAASPGEFEAPVVSEDKARTDSPAEAEPPEGSDISHPLPTDRDLLLGEWKTMVATIREDCLRYVKSSNLEEAGAHLEKVYRGVRFLAARANLAGCTRIAQLATTLEAMLFEQILKGKSPSPSWTESLAQAVDCFEHLFVTCETGSTGLPRKPKVLLVDDDSVCNMANEIVLNRVNYQTVSATDGVSALALMEQTRFDLVLLDIDMPGMSGFEVCERLRRIPGYKHTPVIFVTLYGDYQNRALSLLSGGDGLISKPISPLELILKGTIHLIHTSDLETARPHPFVETQGRTEPQQPAPSKEVSVV